MWRVPQDTQPGQAGLDHRKADAGVDPPELQLMPQHSESMEALNEFRLKEIINWGEANTFLLCD